MAAHSYRPDIDGLRAVAVLAVVAFHVSSRVVSGGFAGVDVFFVISGYLITGLIQKQLDAGRFGFLDFYKRRIKRLLPAYAVVSLFTLDVSSYLLIPNDYIFYTTSLAASWAFCSNVFFSMLSWGYFGQRTEEFPLLHTWSLSVEEQFYFLFPALLLLLQRRLGRAKVPVLIAAAVVFVALSEWKTGRVGTYFLLPYRAHELLIGALAFFASERKPAGGRHAALLAVLGAVLVLGSLFLLRREMHFPGLNSLYPSVGTALLLYAGTGSNAVSALLSHKRLVAIGLISYSLYLWHWPIFSFLRYRQIELTAPVALAAVLLSVGLAYLTWRYVEMPIRMNRSLSFRAAGLRYYAAPAALFLMVGLYSYGTEGAPARFSPESRQLISSYSFERDLKNACAIKSGEYQGVTLDYLQKNCAFGVVGKKEADILLYGDSHANHFKPFVETMAREGGLEMVYYVEGSCSAIDLAEGGNGGSGPSACQRRNADLLKLAGNFRFVAVASFWDYKGREALFDSRLDTVVRSIVAAGATPVLFKDNPFYSTDLSQCVLFRQRGWTDPGRDCNIPYRFVSDSQDSMNAVIDRIQRRYPQTVVVDPRAVMCNTAECLTSIGNIALYKDANHINAKAAVLLAQRYMAAKGNPFAVPARTTAMKDGERGRN